MVSSATEPGEEEPDAGAKAWAVFAFMWAAAVLFHVVGNPTLAPEWGRASLVVAALPVLARPRVPVLAMPLVGAVLVNVWLEAPVLGNHWLLHGFVATVVGAGVLGGSSRRPEIVHRRVAGPLRLTLLAFYSFAAFAKLNADFFDPAVSCATFYLQESAASWSLGGLVDDLPAAVDRLLAFSVAGAELAIPVLLVVRRTRNLGVVFALAFHFVLALDRSHQFFDFSSALAVLFVLFLDPDTTARQLDRLAGWARNTGRGRESGPELVVGLVIGPLVVLAGLAALPPEWVEWSSPALLRDIGVWVWIVHGLALLGFAAAAVRRWPGDRPRRLAGTGTGASRLLLVLPALAVVNGLSPYVELKSGFGWNMYSNLQVVDGASNHLLVRRGLPITDGHERLVTIVSSSEPGLGFYAAGDWLVPEVQLLDYIADRPDATVEARVDGAAVSYEGGGGGARPAWRQKFQVFRAVDAGGAVSCQPSFGPAR